MQHTSQATSLLAKPQGDERISERTLGYVSEMAREEAFDMITSACVEAGVQRGALARRLGKDPAQVSRLLSAPGNWTLDTIAELLFAIDGSMLRTAGYAPLREPISNSRFPNCLEGITVEPSGITASVTSNVPIEQSIVGATTQNRKEYTYAG